MRGNNALTNRPYLPFTRRKELKAPYICRLAPYDDSFEIEWLDKECAKAHTLFIREKGSENEYKAIALDSCRARIEGLFKDTDYEIFVESEIGERSNLRFVRTGAVPSGCTVINYLHPDDTQYDFSGRYLCSPSLARARSGRLIAGMDLYGNRMAQNLTLLFASDDDGKSWRYLCDLYPFYWGSLFYHNDVLYILGLSTEYGNLQIACSVDEGESWSAPVTLFYGSSVLCRYGGMHRAPMHMTEYKGRLYTTCEYGSWASGSHIPAILSIDKNDDPMIPENWTCSDFLPYDGEWKAAEEKQGDTMEGNITEAPSGELYSIMRWKVGSFLKLKVDTQNIDNAPTFVCIKEAPVSNSMFRIIKRGDKYILITNRRTEESAKYENISYRNVLSVFESTDLESFTFIKDIVNRETEHPKRTGFQYPTFINEKDSISLVIRSAFNNSDDFHNSNYMLFYRLDID